MHINKTTNYYKNSTPPVKPYPQETIVPSPKSIEWIDLGLPSGTFWAKADAVSQISFYQALGRYSINVPSIKQAEELQQCCSREWNSETKSIIMKGPNGNSISFYCPDSSNTSFWLNTKECWDCGNCFHLGKDKHFWINDKDVSSLIGLHLVKRP